MVLVKTQNNSTNSYIIDVGIEYMSYVTQAKQTSSFGIDKFICPGTNVFMHTWLCDEQDLLVVVTNSYTGKYTENYLIFFLLLGVQ